MKGAFSSSLLPLGVTFRRLFGFTKDCRVKYVVSMLLTASRPMIKTIGLGFGAMLILETALGGDVHKTLRTVCWVAGVCFTLVCLYSFGALLLDNCVVFTSSSVRRLIIRHITRIPAAWYDKHHSGDIMSRMLTDMNSGMQNALNMPAQIAIGIIMNGVASLIALFTLEWRTALLIVAISAVSTVFTAILAEPGRRVAQQARESNAEVAERLTDIVAASPLIKVHSLYNLVLGRLNDSVDRSEKRYLGQGGLLALNELLGNTVRTLVYLGVMGVGVYGMSQGRLDAPQLIAVLQISSGPIELFMRIGASFLRLQNALVGAQRVFDLLDVPVEEHSGHVNFNKSAVPMEAVSIRFGYDPGHIIIKDANMTVGSRARTAFVGPSGGGKSTMLKLISGLYTCEGELRIFGEHIDRIPRGQLRDTVIYVPQFPHMFMGTVFENIALAKPDATREEVEDATRRVGAHEFILSLAGGYDYPVSERGHNLSGGECQRIALARALLKHPALLLLDEPTSALDLQNEAVVTRSIGEIKDSALIFATHRPSLLQIADEVVEIG